MRIGSGRARRFLIGAVVFVLGGVCAAVAFGQLSSGERDQPDLYGRQVAPQRIGRLPCNQIVEKVDRQRRRDPKHPVDVTMLSRRLHQSALWVERCMEVYGRQVERPVTMDSEAREERMEAWEEREPNEIGHEETRDGRMAKPRAERRRKKVPATPTPFTGAPPS